MTTGLSKPTVQFNGVTFFIVPNSLHIMYSGATVTMRAQSGGGTSTQRVATEDVTEDYATATFEVITTADNVTRLEDLVNLSRTSNNGIEFSFFDSQNNLTGTINQARICNAPDYKMAADGTVEITVKGDPVGGG